MQLVPDNVSIFIPTAELQSEATDEDNEGYLPHVDEIPSCDLLASSLSDFRYCGGLFELQVPMTVSPFVMTNHGVHFPAAPLFTDGISEIFQLRLPVYLVACLLAIALRSSFKPISPMYTHVLQRYFYHYSHFRMTLIPFTFEEGLYGNVSARGRVRSGTRKGTALRWLVEVRRG